MRSVLQFTGASLLALVVVACPRFETAGRTKSYECRSTLSDLVAAERSFFSRRGRYTTLISDLFQPERNNRYLYLLDPGGRLQLRTSDTIDFGVAATGVGVDVYRWGASADVVPTALPPQFFGAVPIGLQGTCPDCSVTIVCAAQLDLDGEMDIWSVSTNARADGRGQVVPPGMVFHDSDDGER